MTQSPTSAALFDIDGTLVDSNYLHIESWSKAFAELGVPVDEWRIHSAIGMDSSKLLETLIGDRAEGLGARLKSLHASNYEEFAQRLRPFDGATDLLRAIAGRNVGVVLATSAPIDELTILRRVLDADDAITAVTSSDDVETAKPEPDIVGVALDRAGVAASRAVFIGDAVWDFAAARKLGLTCIGLRSGGTSAEQLEHAGASAVYDDTAQLLQRMDQSPLATLWQ